MEKIGVINPKPGERPFTFGTIYFEIDGDKVVSVEIPDNPRKNIIRKPFATLNSPVGEALLSVGALKKSPSQ